MGYGEKRNREQPNRTVKNCFCRDLSETAIGATAAKSHFVARCRLSVGEIAESLRKAPNQKLRCGIALVWQRPSGPKLVYMLSNLFGKYGRTMIIFSPT